MKAHEFMHEMRTTSAILGRSSGLSVVFEGDQAMTNGKTITLPSLPQQVDLTHEQVLAMRGYVDHEAGHIRHSDMPRIISFYDKNGNNGRPELSHLHNALEDVWMEEEVLAEYPGAWKNLAQSHESMRIREYKGNVIEATPEQQEAFKSNPNTMASVGITYNKNENFQTTHNDLMKGFIGEEWDEMGAHYAQLARDCNNSNEIIELAKKIFQYNDEVNPEDQSPEDFDQKAEAGELSDMEGEEAEGDNSEGFDPNGTEEMKAALKGEAKGEAQEGGADGEFEGLVRDRGETLMAADDDALGGGGIGSCVDNGLRGGYRVVSTADDKVFKRGGKSTPGGSTRVIDVVEDLQHWGEYDQRKTELKSDVMVMKNKLRRAVMAKQQRDWDFGRENGRLDSKRLVAAYGGARQVYKRRTDRESLDTAITILVDLSGSMSGDKAQVARDCAIALAECFEGTQIQYRISGFCNRGRRTAREGKYHRYEALNHVIFKDHDATLRQTRGSIYRIPEAVGGNNSDYDFVDAELFNLSRRTESRKVLFVLSDGCVACTSDAPTSEHERLIAENLAYYKTAYGVESVGLGICDSSVEGIYKDNVVVNDVSDLSGTVFGKLTNILFKEKSR